MDNSARLDRRLCREYPGLFVILLDQSGSMNEQVAESHYKFVSAFDPNAVSNARNACYTKADVATAAINTIIFEMVQDVGYDAYAKVRKKSVYLSVIGYNTTVYPLIAKTPDSYDPIDLPSLFEKPAGHVEIKRPLRTEEGIIYRNERQPYWIKPYASGRTEMAQALEKAKSVADGWLKSRPEFIPELELWQKPRHECFPPVIINITDARPNGEGNPVDVARQIKHSNTGAHAGELLIFNCHFTAEKGRSITFPNDTRELEHLDATELPLAKRMFEMSSSVPDVLCEDARKIARKPINANTRCYVYNADPNVLLEFLRWGTRGQFGTESQGIS